MCCKHLFLFVRTMSDGIEEDEISAVSYNLLRKR